MTPSTRSTLAVVFAALLVATPAGADGPAATEPSASTARFTSADKHVAFDYPADWVQKPYRTAVVELVAPAFYDGHVARIQVQVKPLAAVMTTGEVAAAIRSAYEKHSIKILGTGDEKLGGLPAQVIDSELATPGQPTVTRQRMVVAVADRKVYSVTYMAPREHYDQFLSKAKAVVESFSITP